MANKLAVSAILTGQYLEILVEYGDDFTLHPELVKSLLVSCKAKDLTIVRELTISTMYANNDGTYKLGTILSSEEQVNEVVAQADTTDQGKLVVTSTVSIDIDSITSKQF